MNRLMGPLFVLLWSSGYVVGTIGTREMPAFALTSWRFLIAAALLGIVAVAGPVRRGRGAAGNGATPSSPGYCCRVSSSAPDTPRSRWARRPRSWRWCCACRRCWWRWHPGRCWANTSAGSASSAPCWPSPAHWSPGSATLTTGARSRGFALLLVGLAGFAAGTLYQKKCGSTDGPAHRHHRAVAGRRGGRPASVALLVDGGLPLPHTALSASVRLPGSRSRTRAAPCCCCSRCCAAARERV